MKNDDLFDILVILLERNIRELNRWTAEWMEREGMERVPTGNGSAFVYQKKGIDRESEPNDVDSFEVHTSIEATILNPRKGS